MGLSSPVIQVKQLEHVYPNGTAALRGVSLEIGTGEFIAVIGQNGSGKTTLVRHFNGLLKPTAGEVLVKGKSVRTTPISSLAASVGYVFQNPDHQIFCHSVWEEIAFGPRMLGFSQQMIAANTKEAIEIMDLEGTDDRHPHSLSRGERQRLAIASVLAIKPEVIVLDEPTGGQDKARTEKLMRLLLQLNQKGHTIIVVTHDIELAAEYARRVVVVCEGGILLDGDPREVFKQRQQLSKTFLRAPDIFELSLAVDLPRPCLTTAEFVAEVGRRIGTAR
jgi:energy-coupling factor transport system ATP-binding protein